MDLRKLHIPVSAGVIGLAMLVGTISVQRRNTTRLNLNHPAAADQLSADGGAPPPTTPKKPSPSAMS